MNSSIDYSSIYILYIIKKNRATFYIRISVLVILMAVKSPLLTARMLLELMAEHAEGQTWKNKGSLRKIKA